jgi:hypothetical protein
MPKGLYKRGNIWWLRYAGVDGKTIFESSGSDKIRLAESLLHKRKADIKDGKQPEIKKIANHTFKELAKEYIPWCERQRGIKQKKLIIKQLTTMYGNLPLRYFNTRIVEQYQTERIKKGNKPATVNNHLATIKHMFTKAVDWNMVERRSLEAYP